MASTPVSAAQPDEKARANRNTMANPAQCPGSARTPKSAVSAWMPEPKSTRPKPHASITTMLTMNR